MRIGPVTTFLFGLGLLGVELAAPQVFPVGPEWVWHWVFWGGLGLLSFSSAWAVIPAVSRYFPLIHLTWRVEEATNSVQLTPADPDYRAWDLVPRFELFQAACLWAGKLPELPIKSDPEYPYLRMLKAAIQDRSLAPHGTLDVIMSWKAGNFQPDINTEVTREALRAFAESRGQRPTFLFPEDRGGVPPENNTIEAVRKLYAEGVKVRNHAASLRVLDRKTRERMDEIGAQLIAHMRGLAPVQSINVETLNTYDKGAHPMLRHLDDDKAFIFSELLLRVRRILEKHPE